VQRGLKLGPAPDVLALTDEAVLPVDEPPQLARIKATAGKIADH
jgi:hypothetical protein